MIRLAREGWPFVASAAVLAAVGWTTVPWLGPWWLPVPVVLTAAAFLTVYFFRDPHREIPEEAGIAVAPADGRVIDVSDTTEESFMGGRSHRISIFLSIFDVHIQRSPVAGMVTHRSYHPGAFLAAWNPRSSTENEQASIGIQGDERRVLVRQIAGLVARRIVTYPAEGDRLDRGQRIGLIRFGSRVDLFVPLDWTVTCKIGDRVYGGATVVAREPKALSA